MLNIYDEQIRVNGFVVVYSLVCALLVGASGARYPDGRTSPGPLSTFLLFLIHLCGVYSVDLMLYRHSFKCLGRRL